MNRHGKLHKNSVKANLMGNVDSVRRSRLYPMVLTRRIIPCLDLKDGRVVKGTNFLGLRDAGDPVELAERYNEQGADEVVFLDITASKEKRGIIIDLIKRAADELFLPLTVGGGLRSLDDIQQILRAGADKVSVNTSAVHDPALITHGAEAFGTQCIVVAMDVRRNFTRTRKQSPSILKTGGHAGMKWSSTAAANPPVSMPLHGQKKQRSGAPARSCSPAWRPTGRRTGLISPSHQPSPMQRASRSSRAAVWERSNISMMVLPKEKPMPALRQASSTTASSRSGM